MLLARGECSSVGRATACGAVGRGFEPRHSPQAGNMVAYPSGLRGLTANELVGC